MNNCLDLLEKLEVHFKDHPKRFKHSVGVAEFAVFLNAQFSLDLDAEKLKMAGLLHDYAKIYDFDTSLTMLSKYLPSEEVDYFKSYPSVIHAVLGAYLIQDELKIKDDDIFDAIYFHTTGKKNMCDFTKVIYIADVVEYGRTYKDVEYFRKQVLNNLDKGLYEILESIIKMLREKNQNIEKNTLEAYNYYRKKVLENEV